MAVIGKTKSLAHIRCTSVEEGFKGDDARAENAKVGLDDTVQGAADLVVGAVVGLGGLDDGEETEDGDDACPVDVSD